MYSTVIKEESFSVFLDNTYWQHLQTTFIWRNLLPGGRFTHQLGQCETIRACARAVVNFGHRKGLLSFPEQPFSTEPLPIEGLNNAVILIVSLKHPKLLGPVIQTEFSLCLTKPRSKVTFSLPNAILLSYHCFSHERIRRRLEKHLFS